MRHVTVFIPATIALASAEQACFFQVRFNHGGFRLERDKTGPKSRP